MAGAPALAENGSINLLEMLLFCCCCVFFTLNLMPFLIDNRSSAFQEISTLINPRVNPAALTRFLRDHLRLDVETLANSLGRSIDDTMLCIHMVLVHMTTHVSNSKFRWVLPYIAYTGMCRPIGYGIPSTFINRVWIFDLTLS